MSGCLKGLFRLAVIAALLVGAGAVWWWRGPLVAWGRRQLGLTPVPAPPAALAPDSSIGAPSPRGLASGEEKLEALGSPGGPDSVVLSANEMASLVGRGVDWRVRKSFDSLRVELLEGGIAVMARLDTRVIPDKVLGPLKAMLLPREPVRIAGPIAIARPGVARWTVREFAVRGIAFPEPAVKALVKQTAGVDRTGAVPIAVAPAVRDVALHRTGVVLYRRPRR